jgi:NADP-dependent 3-hydroxy acid dehydrogenase YdfG
LIVGAGPGIGQAVARKFGGEGWTVALIGRSADRLASLGAELSATGIAVHTLTACIRFERLSSSSARAAARSSSPAAALV